jgi:HEAT repeat protein
MEKLSNLEGLNDEDLRIRASAIIALGQSGDKNAVATLKTILENKSEVEWVRGCAAIALGRVSGEEGLPPLVAGLQDESLLVCRAAISALGDLKSRKAVPHLEAILNSPEKKDVHAAAVSVLGTIGGDEVVSIMLQALENPDAGVRCNAALALGNLRLKKAVSPLIALMRDEDESLRAVAASSLGLIGDRRAVAVLIAALNDKAAAVRAIAASSLGYLDDKEAIPFLEKVLDDNNAAVRKQSANAILKLRSQ